MIELRQLSVNPRATDPGLFDNRIVVSEGFAGVIRVANELRIARLDPTSFQAFPEGDDLWCVEFLCTGERDRMENVRKRLYRIPTVVRIHCWRVESTPV